jgi:hypothetical protein
VARPNLIENLTAFRFTTGREPGCPVHTGQVKVFGSSPKVVEHPQNIFDRVSSWAWTSRPMTGSYSINISSLGYVMFGLKI